MIIMDLKKSYRLPLNRGLLIKLYSFVLGFEILILSFKEWKIYNSGVTKKVLIFDFFFWYYIYKYMNV